MPVGSSEIPMILPSASSSPLSWSLGNPAQPFWIQGEVPFLPDSTAWLVIPPNRAPDCPTCTGRKWMPRSPSDNALWNEHPLPGSKRPVIPSQTVIFLPLHSFAPLCGDYSNLPSSFSQSKAQCQLGLCPHLFYVQHLGVCLAPGVTRQMDTG